VADVTLVLKADNSDYVRKMREAETASQKVYTTAEKGAKQEQGRIEELRQTIDKLKNARDKAYSIDKIEAYNKRIKEEIEDLKELETAGLNVRKSTDQMGEAVAGAAKKLTLVGAAIALITKVVKDMVVAIKDTTGGLNAMTVAGEAWKQLIYNLITLNNDYWLSMSRALATAKMINEERVKERKDLVEIAKLREKYNQLYFESVDRTKTDAERLKTINDAMEKHNELIDAEVENTQRQLTIVQMQLINRPKSNKLLDEEAKLLARLAEIEGRRWSETKRLESQRTILEKEIHDKQMQRYFDEIEAANKAKDEKLKIQKEFKDLSLKLIDEYDRAEIESLEGAAKLTAQRDYELKAIELFKEQMKKLGTLSPEQEKMFIVLGQKVWEAFYKGLQDIEDKDPLMKWFNDNFEKDLEKYTKDANKAQHEENEWYLNYIDNLIKGQKDYSDAVKQASNIVIDAISEEYDHRAEIATRTRELLDQQISELQQDIEIQLDLYKAGYAANVKLKLDELDALKAARDRALREEQQALDTQRAIELAIQSVNLATSITSLFKDEIKNRGVYGLITGAVAAGAFLLLWEQYKSEAEAATKLAKGGSGSDTGMVTGRSHATGGERFTDHLEVERGEAWGVLSVPATQKYGKIFHEMVSSFNKGELPAVVPATTVNNKVLVDNNGSNSRLDQLIQENRKLNEKLSTIESVKELGSMKIIQRGNTTRIIKR
jgi:hypothetical protein